MKILYLHQYFNTPDMPGGTRSYEMARRLVEQGHDVDMITTDRRPDAPPGWRISVEAGIRVHWLSVPYANRMGFAARMKAFLRFASRAGRKAVSLGGDVVFATSTPLTIAIPAVHASRRLRVPMVFEVRDLWPDIPIALGVLRGWVPIFVARALEGYAYRNAAQIVALSPGMRDGVVRRGYAEERIHTIPNSSDLELFEVDPSEGIRFRRRHDWLQDRPLVLYAGTFGRVNGVDYAVRIAVAMRDEAPDVRFLLVGDGGEKEQVVALAEETGVLGDNLFVMPQVAKHEVPVIFAAATITTSFVIDVRELWANSANKFFDGLAAGRPIAINHRGWQAELIESEDIGIVLPPDDAAAAARSLADAVRNADWLATAGERARRLAEERFARDDLAAQLEGVLVRAVADSQP